jgi:glycosyltransferase involved in cell wall biosynthesis
MGSESHEPNKDGVEWFINQIFPKLNKNKKLPFHITGKWSPEFKGKFKNHKDIFFTGYLDDISLILKDSILVVPIRIGGGGIRAKVIQAMAFGIPVISTTIGCEGIGVMHEESILIANNEEEFVFSISKIITDKKLTEKLIKNARLLIESKYTAKTTGEGRDKIYKKLLSEKRNIHHINS